MQCYRTCKRFQVVRNFGVAAGKQWMWKQWTAVSLVPRLALHLHRALSLCLLPALQVDADNNPIVWMHLPPRFRKCMDA